jgi:hypothetical protein
VYEVDLDVQRSVGGIWAETIRLYRRYPLLFAILALAVMAPYELGVLAITGYGPLRNVHESVGISWQLFLLRTSLITPLIAALHMHAVVAIGDGHRPRLKAVALRGLHVLPVVAAAEVMATFGIGLGFILIVPGILLLLRWAVVAQTAALEEADWLAALRSSQHLTATHYGHVFGLLLLDGVLAFAVSRGAQVIPLGSSSGATSVAVGVVADSVVASFVALTSALLYFDLRARPSVPRRREREYKHLHDLE